MGEWWWRGSISKHKPGRLLTVTSNARFLGAASDKRPVTVPLTVWLDFFESQEGEPVRSVSIYCVNLQVRVRGKDSSDFL